SNIDGLRIEDLLKVAHCGATARIADFPGIYLLTPDDSTVYVGQSMSILDRIRNYGRGEGTDRKINAVLDN
ncbi:hypothetical protein OC861_006987, partial [Tilletia horrida]